MEYLIGVLLGVGVCVFGTIAGFDRDRSFYPVMLIVIASYYDLFAAIGAGYAFRPETVVLALFILASLAGMRISLWIVAAALLAHGLFDLYHGELIANAGVPAWWPKFCLAFDVLSAAYLAITLKRNRIRAEIGGGYRKQVGHYIDADLAASREVKATDASSA